MKIRLLVSAAVCALALGSVNTYAGNFGHGYGNNGGKDNFSKFEKFKGSDHGKKFDKFKGGNKRGKDNRDCETVPSHRCCKRNAGPWPHRRPHCPAERASSYQLIPDVQEVGPSNIDSGLKPALWAGFFSPAISLCRLPWW